MRIPRFCCLLAGVIAVGMLAPNPAFATFHEILIREVYAGGASNDSYVVLQAYSSGQNFVGGHSVTAYNASGGSLGAFTFGDKVGNGQNQMTILVADSSYASTFPTGPAPDGIEEDLNLTRDGGAVCWAELDCVSWGSFGGGPLASPAGPPAGAVPEGMALRRTIAPGCATLLELFDDRNDSSLDFSPVFPSPRSNSVAPSEVPCGSGGGPKGEGGGKKAPETRLKRRPPQRSRDRTPTFRFTSDLADAKFECRIDRKRFKPCRSPFTTRRLSLGRHTFQVRANDPSGPTDQSPATDTFKLVAPK